MHFYRPIELKLELVGTKLRIQTYIPSPPVMGVMPVRQLMEVVFPAPFGPRRQNNWLFARFNHSPCKINIKIIYTSITDRIPCMHVGLARFFKGIRTKETKKINKFDHLNGVIRSSALNLGAATAAANAGAPERVGAGISFHQATHLNRQILMNPDISYLCLHRLLLLEHVFVGW